MEPKDVLVVLGALGASAALYTSSSQKARRHLPPGPPGRWLIGNLLDIPAQFAWFEFSKWRKAYGDINYAHALGQSFIILNSLKDVNELLEKRAENYSDQPSFVMAGELMGSNNFPTFFPDGPKWKIASKVTHAALRTDAVKQYAPTQELYLRQLLISLLDRPQDYYDEIRMAMGRIMVAITYGTLPEETDKFVEDCEEVFRLGVDAMQPGRFLVDLIPALKHIPSWIPGSPRGYGKPLEKRLRAVFEEPFDYVQSKMASGINPPSFTSEVLLKFQGEKTSTSAQDDEDVKWIAGQLFAAGAETTHASLFIFLLAMVQNVDVQRKAQAEIDRVVPDWRLPNADDYESLPYTAAVVQETLRRHPVTPLSMVRQSRVADTYKGMYIPPKSLVLANTWEISREECGAYPPDDFVPERFLHDQPPLDPNEYAFGFGRRHCPGKKLGLSNVRLFIIALLATFDILPMEDENGKLTVPDPQWVSGLSSYPKQFPVRFQPRSDKIVQILREKTAY